MKILFVCLGNICRSPLAEGIMRHKLKELEMNIEVDSAGTGAWIAGETPDKRTIAIAHKNGVDVSKLRARRFCVDDFAEFDKIFVMDFENQKHVLSMAPNKQAKQKVEILLDMLHPTKNPEVPDPWFGGEKDFEHVFNLLNDACEYVIEEWKK